MPQLLMASLNRLGLHASYVWGPPLNTNTILKKNQHQIHTYHSWEGKKNIFMICEPYNVVTLPNWTPILEWYMASHVLKNRQLQRHMLQRDWAMCLEARYYSRFNTSSNWENYAFDENKDALVTFASQPWFWNLKWQSTSFGITNPTVQFVFGVGSAHNMANIPLHKSSNPWINVAVQHFQSRSTNIAVGISEAKFTSCINTLMKCRKTYQLC